MNDCGARNLAWLPPSGSPYPWKIPATSTLAGAFRGFTQELDLLRSSRLLYNGASDHTLSFGTRSVYVWNDSSPDFSCHVRLPNRTERRSDTLPMTRIRQTETSRDQSPALSSAWGTGRRSVNCEPLGNYATPFGGSHYASGAISTHHKE